MQEEAAFARFRRALRRSDQLALDDLFTSARQHLAAAQYASHALPFEVFLLAMLLEEHKQVMRLRQEVEELLAARAASAGVCAGPGGRAARETLSDSQDGRSSVEPRGTTAALSLSYPFCAAGYHLRPWTFDNGPSKR